MIAKPEPGSTLRKIKRMDPDTDSALEPGRIPVRSLEETVRKSEPQETGITI
jgi:hypothetical protein